jgi:peptide/nickel transport system permease protein
MRHLLRRILFYLAAVWASVTLNFFIPRLAPGNPVQAVLGKLQRQGVPISPDTIKSLETSLGLTTSDPLWLQYFHYLSDLLHGNFGRSLSNYPTPVTDIIGQGIVWTIGLGAIAVVIGFILGSLIGILTAWKRGSALDNLLSPAITFFYAIPPFWLALLVVYFFGFTMGWFPFTDSYDTSLDAGLSWPYIKQRHLSRFPACDDPGDLFAGRLDAGDAQYHGRSTARRLCDDGPCQGAESVARPLFVRSS